MKFGDILRELREEKGITQKELGAVINISDRVIGYWESNDRFPKDGAIIVELANFFGVSTDFLLSNTNKDRSSIDNELSSEELRLIHYYKMANNDDKNVIWAVLNKYKKQEERKKEAT